MSEDGRSEASVTTAGGPSRRKRSVRTSTTFQLAHPAPTASQKLNIRPNLLLQLQQISATARPKPFLDVLPSTTLAPRLRTRFPRMFRSKAELGCNDVMVVKSEVYEGSVENKYEGGDSDEDGLDRELVAVICQMPKDSGGSQGKAEAVLSDGTVWACSPNLNGPNGPYEFEKTDAQGKTTIARWVMAKNRRSTADSPETIMNANREMKFTFSMIDPRRRKHPILATITPNRLDISDSYTTTSSSAGINSPTSSAFRTSGEEAEESEGDAALERKVIVVEEDMKTIIRVTGIWVALRQGWSQCFKYNDTVTLPHAQTGPGSANRKSTSCAHDIVSGRLSPAPTVASMPESCRSSLGSVLGGKIRRASGIRSPENRGSPQFDRLPTKPKRAASSGAAFMQRAARRAGNAISTVKSESEGEGESESMMESQKRVIQSDDANGHRRLATPPLTVAVDSPMTAPETTTQSQKRPVSYQPTTGSSLQEAPQQPAARRRFGPNRTHDVKQNLGKWTRLADCFRRTKKGAGSDSSA
ncbi:uncharacterized protein L3040_002415 [Drepanopeziza brunnea f. sp. 'multigermtubi']|nr:hypothetical protein L3040_002415 [Drepanopeziza brunnea f. sp. 'multigermtubi']